MMPAAHPAPRQLPPIPGVAAGAGQVFRDGAAAQTSPNRAEVLVNRATVPPAQLIHPALDVPGQLARKTTIIATVPLHNLAFLLNQKETFP